MIEKLMKAVKRGNKKRSKNITIGVVIGLLLSCTGVIKAEDKYLWIRENNGAIEFNTGVTTDDNGAGGNWSGTHPYSDENSWDGSTYVNNMKLSSSADNGVYSKLGISYGLRLSGDLSGLNFINNGLITGTGNRYGYGIIYNLNGEIAILTNSGLITGIGSSYGYGIRNENKIGTLINSGLIKGTGSNSGSGISNDGDEIGTLTNSGLIIGTGSTSSHRISNDGAEIGTLTNSGLIKGIGRSSSGIYNLNGEITILTNSGLIMGTGSSSGYGIYNGRATITTLTNSGLIKGTGSTSGYGIRSTDASSAIGSLTNTGVIYGDTNAVYNDKANSGTVSSAYNYGILANGNNNDVIAGLDVVYTPTTDENKILNYGLIIKNGSEIVDNGKNGEVVDIAEYNDDGTVKATRKMTIKNKSVTDGSDSFTGNESDSILNALTNTYKAGTGTSKITDSIINAYKTAVKFDTGGELTLSGTVVNGGINGASNTISGSGAADTLILQSGEAGQNTIINGDINMGAGNDTLTIGTGTIINGTLGGGADEDTLNFGTASKTRVNTADEINIQHNISSFENININTNVTLFETTVDSSGNPTDLKVTGVNSITIGANGVLTLRIDSANGNKHALSTGNTGAISSIDGGKLLLALNGAGNNSIISFETTELDNSLVTGNTLNTTSKFHTLKKLNATEVKVTVRLDIPEILKYEQLNKIYRSTLSVKDLIGNFNVDSDEKLSIFLGYLNDIYAGNPYSYSSELSRKSMGMFRDIIAENQFKADTGKWLIYGGLTHVDGGNKDTYYGKGYYTYDIGSSDIEADTKITGAYILGEYGVSDTLTSGVIVGGNKLKSDLSNGSKVDGDALYMGAYAKKYIGNLKVTAGMGFQYGDYDTDRLAVNKTPSSTAEPVMKYSDNYNDISYDIYLNGRYSHNIGDNLYLEPYGTLSYTYIKQDSADEGGKTLAIETDSKSFDYTSAKVGVDLKKVISHEKGKSTLSAGVSYTRLLNGADEEYITGRFKGGKDFDILVAHKNEHSIGLNAKYALELENGVLFDVKGTYAVERDSNNNSGKNKTKGEWIVGAGLGYKF